MGLLVKAGFPVRQNGVIVCLVPQMLTSSMKQLSGTSMHWTLPRAKQPNPGDIALVRIGRYRGAVSQQSPRLKCEGRRPERFNLG